MTPAPAARLAALRAGLAAAGVDGFLVPRADEHLGEYVPASAERLAWLTGFTGSAGLAAVLPDRAALFVDGRYTTQAAREADPALWEHRHLTGQPLPEWLRAHAGGLRVGYDPWLHPEPALDRLAGCGAELVPLDPNPLDLAWTDRPAPPASPVTAHPLPLAGRSSADKRAAAAAELRAAGHDAAVLADPASLAWLLNLRAADVPFTPLPLGFLLLGADGGTTAFLDPARLAPGVAAALGPEVVVRPRAALPDALDALGGRVVRVDPDATPAWCARRLRAAGAHVRPGDDPCRLPRACKNPVERDGARLAHRRDAAAMAAFLAWFEAEAPTGRLTEMTATDRLLACRAAQPDFRGESFPAISGAGPNGAVVHYRATPATDRRIGPGECYLIDSGGQYGCGTTDVTRTLWTGPGPAPAALRASWTRVLRGHAALATLRFPEGVAGPHLDAIARRPLWDAGEDYDHGTGHGVGSYLSVHEGPAAFSRAARPVPLREGMVLSDEPGFYQPGEYGIRLENLLLVRPAAGAAPAGEPPRRRFLEFETLTLAPFDRRLLDADALAPAERAWLDAYHARVLAEVAPLVEPGVAAWLAAACAPA